MVTFLNHVYQAYEKNMEATGVYLDFAKAFDKVSHSALLRKLQNIGVKGRLLQIVCSYFNELQQFVRVDSVVSDML